MVDRVDHVLGTRVHGLTALDQVICANALKDLAQPVSNGYRNEAIWLSRLILCCLCLVFPGFLLCCLALCVLDHAFLVLLAHIVDLHAGQGAKGQCLLDGKPRIVGMNMYFYNVIIGNHHDGITDRLQISLELMFAVFIVMLLQIDDELGAVAIFDMCRVNVSGCCTLCFCRCACRRFGIRNRDIHFLAADTVKCAL